MTSQKTFLKILIISLDYSYSWLKSNNDDVKALTMS